MVHLKSILEVIAKIWKIRSSNFELTAFRFGPNLSAAERDTRVLILWDFEI